MGKSFKRRVALLLTAAMLLTTNAVAFAGNTLSNAALSSNEESKGANVDARLASMLSTETEIVTPVSSPKDDPMTWSKDPRQARYTYLKYLPELSGYTDNDMVSMDMIVNGKKVVKPAVTAEDLPVYIGVSYNCASIGSNKYVIWCYGINNDFDGGKGSLSANNYYGMTPDGKAAGVFDYTPFTWYRKDGGLKANGNIIYEAAVISWSQGGEAVKERIYQVDRLKMKNNLYATVSFDAVGGKWKPLEYNYFQKSRSFAKPEKNQPSFYPIFSVKKSYRGADGKRVKAQKEDKKYLKTINKAMKKDGKIEFEIRRRPIAGSVSSDYIDSNGIPNTPYKYMSLMGDDLSFNEKTGKLKKATPQFKSITYKKDSDNDSDDYDNEKSEAGKDNSSAKASGFYLTHVLKMEKVAKSKENDANLQEQISKGEVGKKKPTDVWYKTRKVGDYETLIVYGANNLEGVAAFRERLDHTIGSGYYKSDDNCFISSMDD